MFEEAYNIFQGLAKSKLKSMNSYLFDRPHPFGMFYDPNYMFYLHSLMLAHEQQRIYANLHLFPQNTFFSREISKIQG